MKTMPLPQNQASTVYVSSAARPRRQVPGWQPAALTVLAAAAAVVATAGDIHSPHLTARLLGATATAAFLAFALTAVLRGTAWLRVRTSARLGDTHASVLRVIAVVAGAATTVMVTLGLLAVPIGQVLLGGALTGALLGIAGQQTLANLAAGVVLLLSRAVAVGDRVRLHSGTLGGPFEGTVTEVGLVHTHLRTADAPLWIPNTQVLGAAIATLDPQAALPAAPTRRPRRRAVRRRQRAGHTGVTRTTRVVIEPGAEVTRPIRSAHAHFRTGRAPIGTT
jgi:hypothetical protein